MCWSCVVRVLLAGEMSGGWESIILFIGRVLRYVLVMCVWMCLLMLVLFWRGGMLL